MSSNLLNINLSVAGRPYRLKVTPEDEAKARRAARLIKDKIQELRGIYGAKDQQDYLAMAALLLCVDLLAKEQEISEEDKDFAYKFDQLDQILTDFVNKG